MPRPVAGVGGGGRPEQTVISLGAAGKTSVLNTGWIGRVAIFCRLTSVESGMTCRPDGKQ